MAEKTLPIWAVMPQIISALTAGKNVTVTAPTGSGKTTQVPQAVLDAGIAKDGVILVVQPRRVASRAVAKRVAEERGVAIGADVGYIVRYEGQTSGQTKVCFITDGVLMRFIERDPTLSGVSVVIFDEFHERRILSDLALSLLRKMQREQRAKTKLRIVVMSATMAAEKIASFIDGESVVAEGRAFPVAIEHVRHPVEYEQMLVNTVVQVRWLHTTTTTGDILVFLPGRQEILQVMRSLEHAKLDGVTVLPLYGELGSEDQDRVFAPQPGRKVILATNIAETSLTIPGITMVVDSGWERRGSYNPRTAADSLELSRISRASADQRAGRAGRECPGQCYRLWTESEHGKFEAVTPPEIRRTDLAGAVLTLKSVGIRDVKSFDFFERPTNQSLIAAERLLQILGALADNGELTKIGWSMLRLPLAPRYARMVVEAERSDCVREVATIAAALSGQPIFRIAPGRVKASREAHGKHVSERSSDLFTVLRVWKEWRAAGRSVEWCNEHFVSQDALMELYRLRGKILRVTRSRGSSPKLVWADGEVLRRCIVAGLLDRVAKRVGKDQYQLTAGVQGALNKGSAVTAEIVVAADVQLRVDPLQRKPATAILSMVTAVDRTQLEQLASPLLSRASRLVGCDSKTGTASVCDEVRYMDLVIAESGRDVPRDVAMLISEAEVHRAQKAGLFAVDVTAEPRNLFSVMVDGHKVFVEASCRGKHWASIRDGIKGKEVVIHRPMVEIIAPMRTEIISSSLKERMARVSGVVGKLATLDTKEGK